MMRPPDEVFEDHLRLWSLGGLETDLEKNHADDVVVLCELGALKGHTTIRKTTRQLGLQPPDADFQFPTKLVEESARSSFKARAQCFEVEGGVNAFMIRGGYIVAQTIFYRLSKGSQPSTLRRLPTLTSSAPKLKMAVAGKF
jgi:hypothetical protein